MVPEGVIVGGWSFVIAAYAVVCTGLVLYAIHLIARLRSVRRQIVRESGDSGTGSSPALSFEAPGDRHPGGTRR